MGASPGPRRIVRFGHCEVDLATGELRRKGLKVRLQDQPFRVLALLLECPGELVTREQLQKAIWPQDTFVDFDEGLDAAVYRLRRAIGDSGEKPQFVETLARRGYRFIGQLEPGDLSAVSGDAGDRSSTARASGNGQPASEMKAPQPTSTKVAASAPRNRVARTVVPVALFASAIILAFALLRLRTPRPVPATTGAKNATGGAIRSLVVLPLENLSGDASQEYFADGMTEVLTTDLGRLAQLRVISRTTAMHYKGTRKTLPQIAEELGVDAVVEGSVARSGRRVRVTAQLVQAQTDKQLWAKSYEGDTADTLVLQDDVARSIAERVMIELSPGERNGLGRFRPVNPSAEEAYFRGRTEESRWNRTALEEGVEYYERALRIDPNYAEAWAGLASTYELQGIFGYTPQSRSRPKARAAAERALELDDSLSDAHVSMASTEWPLLNTESVSVAEGRRAWLATEKELRTAIALNPNNAMAHQWLGYYLAAVGRFDEAIAEMKRTLDLDPLSSNARNSLGAAYYWAGKYADALQQFQQVPDPDANSERRHLRMARIYEQEGMLARSIREWMAALRFAGEPGLADEVGRTYQSSGYEVAKNVALKGDIHEKVLHLKELGNPSAALDVAGDYALLGESAESLHWIETAERGESGGLAYLKIDDRFAMLHADPRFQELLVRIGLPP